MKYDSQTILGKSSYLTLILRLVLDADDRLNQGACVATTGEVIATFTRLDELPSLIESAIYRQMRSDKSASSEF